MQHVGCERRMAAGGIEGGNPRRDVGAMQHVAPH